MTSLWYFAVDREGVTPDQFERVEVLDLEAEPGKLWLPGRHGGAPFSARIESRMVGQRYCKTFEEAVGWWVKEALSRRNDALREEMRAADKRRAAQEEARVRLDWQEANRRRSA